MRFGTSLAAALIVAAGAFAAGAQGLPDPEDIEVVELGAVDPFEVGLSSALGGDVWSSGDAAALRAALHVLPAASGPGWSQPAAARLARRELFAAGDPPSGGEDDFTLAALRADRALAAAAAQHAYELLSRTPRLNESAALTQLFVETAAALGRTEAACQAVRALLDGRDGAYHLRARAACHALDGAAPAAELTAELARAQSSDAGYDRLLDAYLLQQGLPDAAPDAGIELALAALVAPETRIKPAEAAPAWLKRAAERTGPMIELPQALPEALEAAEALQGADRAAALGALIQQDLDREIAAEALALRLADAAQAGAFLEAADAYGPEIARLPITADTLAHGPRFVLAALVADDLAVADAWRRALLDGPPAPRPEPQLAPTLGPSAAGPAALAPPPGYAAPEAEPWTPPPASVTVPLAFAAAVAEGRIEGDAFAARLAAEAEAASPRALCHVAALSALGAPGAAELRAAMTGLTRNGEAPATGPALLAAAAGARGETQLHAARLIERHPEDGEACAAAAFALDAAGLREEALRLILELIVSERM